MFSQFFDKLAIVFFVLYTLAAVLVSVHRFWQYEVFYYDFGIFDQAIWKVSQFQAPIIEHLVVGGKWNLADHFTPGLYLLAPLYWLTDKQEIMLAAQAISVGLSAGVLYLIGKKVLNHSGYAFICMVVYALFVGLQNAIISDMHEVTFMTLPLMLVFWAVVTGRKKALYIFLLLMLSFKESTFLLGFGIALWMLVARRGWWKHAVAVFLISAVWGYLAINVFIPYFAQAPYQYKPDMPKGPINIAKAFFDEKLKRETLFYTLASFGFVALLAPQTWPLLGQDFLVRFVPYNTGTRWTMGLHYSAQTAVVLGIATVYGLWMLRRLPYTKKLAPFIAIGILGLSVFIYQFVLHGPLGLSYNPAFYTHSKDFEFLNVLVRQVPKDATVMTQNNIASHLTHQTVWLFRDNYQSYKPEYIVFDLRPDQNPNDFFGGGDVSSIYKTVSQDKQYEVIFATDYQFIFKRKS